MADPAPRRPHAPPTPARASPSTAAEPGRTGVILPALDVPEAEPLPERFLRRDLRLPEMSQNEIIRYFLGLSRLNYSIDTGFYPLGSCTMKYNPKINEDVARLPGFALAHPNQPAETSAGRARRAARAPGGAPRDHRHGRRRASRPPPEPRASCPGILMVKEYLADQRRGHRRKVLVPDSAHGTNPATAAMAGFEVVTVPSDADGNTDLAFLDRPSTTASPR